MIDMGTSQNIFNQLSSPHRKIIIVKQRKQEDRLLNAIMKTGVRRRIKKITLLQELCLTEVIHLRSVILKNKERQSSTFLSQNDLISLVKICTLRNTTNLQSLLHITTQELLSQTSAQCHLQLALNRRIVTALSTSTEDILTITNIPNRAKMCNQRGTTSLMSLIILTKVSQHQIDGKT